MNLHTVYAEHYVTSGSGSDSDKNRIEEYCFFITTLMKISLGFKRNLCFKQYFDFLHTRKQALESHKQHSSCIFGQSKVEFSAQKLTIATKGFGGSCQFVQANNKIVPLISPCLFFFLHPSFVVIY
jgi:hypothetical protein